ncbi:helix-turn-helix domain-containing protein [Bacillus sp. SM2101]|uniref:helix-turn-helix domain-containing protein n=1 Tax=Bacillus sp. SM2101 TaxID=2805366 RepID=UPI001BDF0DEB|nr:helix-turn-helix domain-containing protein [Bacillus sp. SM2101]
MMNTNEKTIVTSQEAARILNVNRNTIYKYVKNGELQTSNKDTWHYDGGYYFDIEELERFKKLIEKPGLTTSEAANILGVKPVTVFNYIKDGKLPSFRQEYRGRIYNFILEDVLNEFLNLREENATKSSRQFYSSSLKIALYQRFQNEIDECCRVITLGEDRENTMMLSQTGEMYSLSEAMKIGFKPSYQINNISPCYKKGEVSFNFIKPTNTLSSIYSFIDLFYQYAGVKNLDIEDKSEFIKVAVKPMSLKIEGININSEITKMKEFLESGEISLRPDGSLLLVSNYEPLTVYLDRDLKEQIRHKAKDEGVSMDELISTKIKELAGKGHFLLNKSLQGEE